MLCNESYDKMDLVNILQAHGLEVSDIRKEEYSYYLETNQFYDSFEQLEDLYSDDVDYLISTGNIVQTDDGYVAINIV